MLQTFQAKLGKKDVLSDNIYLLRFILDKPLQFTPGQYAMFKIPQGEDTVSRLFSITSSENNVKYFDFVAEYFPTGAASEYFKKMNIGDTITVQAPAGMFMVKNPNHDMIFMATGTGIGPVRSILNSLLGHSGKRGTSASRIKSDREIVSATDSGVVPAYSAAPPQNDVLLLWGLRHNEDVYFLNEFKQLSKDHPNFSFKICLSREIDLEDLKPDDRPYFHLGRVNNYYEELTLNSQFSILNSDHYLCGSRQIVESLRNYLNQKGIKKENVIFEKF